MADRTVADLVVDRLRAWRVPRVFGYPGEAIAPVASAGRSSLRPAASPSPFPVAA